MLIWTILICVGLMLLIAPGAQAAPGPATTQARIIVKWKSGSTRSHAQLMTVTRTDFRAATGLSLRLRHALSEHMDALQLEQPLPPAEFAKALEKLRAQPDVEYAVPDERRYISTVPDEQYFTPSGNNHGGQWYLQNTEPAAIDAVGAWDYSQGGSSIGTSVIVAVVDTGVRFDHPDLAGKLLPGYDFVSCDQTNCSGSGQTFLTANDGDGWDADASDPGDWVSSEDLAAHSNVFNCTAESSSWHGTRVAGMIGAATNNGIGIAGIGWNTRILPIRALGKCGGYDSAIIAGVRWAAGLAVSGVPINPNPAKVINLSLGSTGTCPPQYADMVATLTAIGVTVVASAGNDSAAVNVPANCSGVIGVVGLRNTGTKVGFSSLGSMATIAAPGGNCGTGSQCQYSLDTTTNLGTLDPTQTCPTATNSTAKCATTPGTNDYTDKSNANLGTSFSAPIVSGTIALMLGANSNLTPAQIISTLSATAKPFPQTAPNNAVCQTPTGSTVVTGNDRECNCTTSLCGAGMINAYAAVLAVASSSSSSSSSAGSSSSASSASSSSASGSTPSANATSAASNSGGGGGRLGGLEILSLAVLSYAAWRRKRYATDLKP